MNASDLLTARIHFVEFHDAVFSEIVVRPNREIVVRFEHLPLYFAAGEARFDVHTSRAELRLEGCEELRSGAVGTDWLVDVEIKNGSRCVRTRELLRGSDADGVEMTLNDGSRLVIRCKRVELRCVEIGAKVETFEGEVQEP